MPCSWVVQVVLGLFWGVLSFSNEVFFRQISSARLKGARLKGMFLLVCEGWQDLN